MADEDEGATIFIADPQPRRRKTDTAIGTVKERGFNVLLNHGPLGVFAIVLITVGGMYFRNAEKRYEQFIDEQSKTNVALHQTNRELQETNNQQNKAFIELSRESTKVIAKNSEVMERVERQLSRNERYKPPEVPERRADVIDLEEFRTP